MAGSYPPDGERPELSEVKCGMTLEKFMKIGGLDDISNKIDDSNKTDISQPEGKASTETPQGSSDKDAKDKIEDESSGDRIDLNDYIFGNWETAWKGNNGLCVGRKEEFFMIVKESYSDAVDGAEKNQEKNFAEKDGMLDDVKKAVAFQAMVGFSYGLFYKLEFFDLTVSLTIFWAIAALQGIGLYAKEKHIGVHKYQETWVRHRNSLHKVQMEMVKYTQELAPYDVQDGDERDKTFKIRFLEIMNVNNEKFVDNMENKEISLSDLPDKLNLNTIKDTIT